MKKLLLTTIPILLITVLIFIGCNSSSDYMPAELKKVRVLQESVSKVMQENSSLLLTDNISLSMVLPDKKDNRLFQSSSIQLDYEDLNFLVETPSNNRVISIISFSSDNLVKGHAIYYLNESNLYLQLDFPGNSLNYKVNGVIFQDILYVQENNCEGCDFVMLKAEAGNTDFDHIIKSPSDISLERLRNKYFKKSSNGEYRLIRPTPKDRDELVTSQNGISEIFDFCGVTHWCKRGTGQQCDAWRAFCFDLDASDCAQESMVEFELVNNNTLYPMTSPLNQLSSARSGANVTNNEGSVFATNLPSEMLYSMRDNLQQTLGGEIYVDFYYELSGHFTETLDLSLGFDVLAMSGDLYSVTNRYLTGSNGTQLFDDNFYQKAVAVIQKSKSNSNSFIYRETMDIMLGEMNRYKNKDVSQVENLLNSPYYY